jgi:hypothetical protein
MDLEGEECPGHHLAVIWLAASVEEDGLVPVHILILVPDHISVEDISRKNISPPVQRFFVKFFTTEPKDGAK